MPQSDLALSARAKQHFLEASAALKNLDICSDDIVRGAHLIADCFTHGGKILLCGNGGSAADCQHMAAEFVSRLTKENDRPGLPAIALTTDTSFLTAYANDIGFAGIFTRQVQALGQPGDVLIGISTSGSSENVLQALREAKARGLKTILLTGAGGKSVQTDCTIAVPSSETQAVQECHLAAEHVLCDLTEKLLFR